jgi:formyl-CoA transferase
LSRTPSKLVTASPERGEHTEAVLSELGYDAGATARLRAKGVV